MYRLDQKRQAQRVEAETGGGEKANQSQDKDCIYATHVVNTIMDMGQRIDLPFPLTRDEELLLRRKNYGKSKEELEAIEAEKEAYGTDIEATLKQKLGPKRTLYPRGQQRGLCAALIRELLRGHDKRNVWGDLQRVVLPLEGSPVLWLCPGCVLSVQQSLEVQAQAEEETKRTAMREFYDRLQANEQFCMGLEEERNRAIDGARRHQQEKGCCLS